jgi:predicted nucleic acid-binding protein
MYLVDTNVLSELPKRRPDPGVIAWFSAQGTVAVSAVTIEELAYGVAKARREQAPRLLEWLDALLAIPPLIVPVDERVARAAGLLRASREKTGRTASQADMLIAATAVATGRTLVTRNVEDFAGCGVALLNPFSAAEGATGG